MDNVGLAPLCDNLEGIQRFVTDELGELIGDRQ